MEIIDAFNSAQDYIEDNLDGEIDLRRAAGLAACSQFHFQRMFAYVTGVSLTEYIRRRRMTKAALELIDGGEKVIDLALKYGYESPRLLTGPLKAFTAWLPARQKAGESV